MSGPLERISVTLSHVERDYLAVGLREARERISASVGVCHSEDLDVKGLENTLEDLDRLWEVLVNEDERGRRRPLQELYREDVRILVAAMELSARHDEEVLAAEREHPLVPSVVEQLESRVKTKREKFVGTNYEGLESEGLLVEWGFDTPVGAWFVDGDDLPVKISPF